MSVKISATAPVTELEPTDLIPIARMSGTPATVHIAADDLEAELAPATDSAQSISGRVNAAGAGAALAKATHTHAIALTTQSISGAHALAAETGALVVDTTAEVDVTLPDPSTVTALLPVLIIDATNNSASKRIRLTAHAGGVEIDGSTSAKDLAHNGGRWWLWTPDGIAWFTAPCLPSLFTAADRTKLDGIEALADVTDATNVAGAGAVMDSDFAGSATGALKRTGAGAYAVRKDNLAAGGGPLVTDDSSAGYEVGSRWIVPGAGELVCLDASVGAAVWALVAAAEPDEYLETDGSVPMAGVLDMGGNDVTGVGAVDIADYAIIAERGGDPSVSAGQVYLYAKDAGGVSALFARTDDDIVYQLAGPPPPITEATAARAFATADHGRVVRCTANSLTTITVSAGALPGTTVEYVGEHADGGVVIVGDGVTLRHSANYVPETNDLYSNIVVTMLDADEALVRGDLAPA